MPNKRPYVQMRKPGVGFEKGLIYYGTGGDGSVAWLVVVGIVGIVAWRFWRGLLMIVVRGGRMVTYIKVTEVGDVCVAARRNS